MIDCGSNCKWCDGFGIMSLYAAPGADALLAPCLECSPTRNLNDLIAARNRAIAAMEKAGVLQEIDEHNKRIREC